MADNTIKPYNISVPESRLEDLAQRLKLAKLPAQMDAEDLWEIGTPLSEVQRLVKYWKNGFDWRKAEAQLNELPNFITSINVDGFGDLDIHFVHQRSSVKGGIPLLFTHGWPGSFLEVEKILPLLNPSDEKLPSFHVVAPSLPNFGFSSGVTKRYFGRDQYAESMHKLMLKLGYSEYVTQGGDWGYSINRAISMLYPDSNKAAHLNMVLSDAPTLTTHPLLYLKHLFTPYSDFELAGLKRSEYIDENGMAYNKIQSTKPQTIGYALEDSPVALLSWIYEKFHAWSDAYPWTDDEILTWVSIYWFSTAGPAASVRIYYEAVHEHPEAIAKVATVWGGWVPKVPLGLASFKGDIKVLPKTWGRRLGPVVFESQHEKGGHFAAWEAPDSLVGDLRSMFGRGGPCFGVVKGKNGF